MSKKLKTKHNNNLTANLFCSRLPSITKRRPVWATCRQTTTWVCTTPRAGVVSPKTCPGRTNYSNKPQVRARCRPRRPSARSMSRRRSPTATIHPPAGTQSSLALDSTRARLFVTLRFRANVFTCHRLRVL